MARISLEKTECTRCYGTGEHSYCEAYGTVCFKCNGSGKQLTPAGKRARTAINEFMAVNYHKPIEAVKAGEQFLFDGKFRTVTEDAHDGGSAFKNACGEWEPFWHLNFGKSGYAAPKGTVITIRPTSEQFRNELLPFARNLAGTVITE